MKNISTKSWAILFVCISFLMFLGVAEAGHGEADNISSLNGNGDGTFTGSFVDPTSDATVAHPWYTFNANAGDSVTINLNSDVPSYIWVYSVGDNNAQIGDSNGVDFTSADDVGGNTANTLVFVAPTTGQYLIQVDKYSLAGTVNYTLIISGSTNVTAVPTLQTWGVIMLIGLMMFFGGMRKKSYN